MYTKESKVLKVMQRVNKEFKEFKLDCIEKGVNYVLEHSLKVSFYKEMKTYILNGVLERKYYIVMYEMEEILFTLWKRYTEEVIDKCGDHFLEQLLDIHINNLDRENKYI